MRRSSTFSPSADVTSHDLALPSDRTDPAFAKNRLGSIAS
ncbi:hypothetical protein AVEN_2873-1, partial [Araneus ventricosus]